MSTLSVEEPQSHKLGRQLINYTLADFEKNSDGPALKLSHIAEALNVSVAFIRQEVRTGEIDGAFKVGNDWRVPWSRGRLYLSRLGAISLTPQ